MLEISRIMDILPHRYPFLLVDRIIEVEGSAAVVGHQERHDQRAVLPGPLSRAIPIMPGVLIIEAMAQVGGVLLMDKQIDPAKQGRRTSCRSTT